MKILVVCQHYYPETFTITSICEEWAKQGHDVLVVTGKPNYGFGRILEGYEKRHDETLNGVSIHRVNLYPRKDSTLSIVRNYLSFWRNSKRYCSRLKEEFDVVYSMSLSPIISVSGANLYAKKHHVRHILHCLDLWPESPVITGAVRKNSLAYKLLYRWSKKIYEKADEILVSSPSFIEYFKEVLKLDGHPIAYVQQPPLLCEQVGKDVVYPSGHHFVYAGNIGTIQLVENLVKAFSLMENKETYLHLIGMGSKETSVKELIRELKLEDRVHFYGPKARGLTAAYYHNADAIIVTLHDGGWVGKTIPNKLTSSLYFARPILACIQGDGRSVLEEAGGSIFSEDETPSSLAKAMEKIASMSEEEKNALGRKNRNYFDKNCSFEECVERINEHLMKSKN